MLSQTRIAFRIERSEFFAAAETESPYARALEEFDRAAPSMRAHPIARVTRVLCELAAARRTGHGVDPLRRDRETFDRDPFHTDEIANRIEKHLRRFFEVIVKAHHHAVIAETRAPFFKMMRVAARFADDAIGRDRLFETNSRPRIATHDAIRRIRALDRIAQRDHNFRARNISCDAL